MEKKYSEYKKLAKLKNFAISKALAKFNKLPLERSDLESIAWMAYCDTVEQYEIKKGRKSFESFFIDQVYWKCSDYCSSFLNNKHKMLNIAIAIPTKTIENVGDNNDRYDYIFVENAINVLSKKYKNKPHGKVLSLLLQDKTIKEICEITKYSKSKVYRIINQIKEDIKQMLN